MREITDLQYEIVDPSECLNIGPVFELARESDCLIARCTFRSDGEKAVSLGLLPRDRASDSDIDLRTYFMVQVQRWADSKDDGKREHMHEWYMCANPAGEIYALCRDIRCHGKVLKKDEIESRLNALEG